MSCSSEENRRDWNGGGKWDCGKEQWRNSYGLRVGKPAGTRAEGAPAGCPFSLVLTAKRITLLKGCTFPILFIVKLRNNSHNDAFYKLMKLESLFGCP